MAPHGWNEEDLIGNLLAPLAGEGAYGLRDDAASVRVAPGYELVVTCDTLVASIHFFPDDPPASIAHKALAVNVSDLAAKGAVPRGYLLSLALPATVERTWLEAFVAGLGEAGRRFGCPLLGGDTTAIPGPLCITVSAFGEVRHGRMVPRTGVRAGDVIGVTGTIGDAALGLLLRQAQERPAWDRLALEERDYLLDRYLYPAPRISMIGVLLDYANAAMDVSDGLIGDLSKMLHVSGVAGRLDLGFVPLSSAARTATGAETALQECVFTGGDDYEILFSVPQNDWDAVKAAAMKAGTEVTRIGSAVAGEGLVCVDQNGNVVTFGRGSYVHRSG